MTRWRKILILLVVGIAVLAGYGGIVLRRAVFEQTMDVHFRKDIVNAYMWGRNARQVGLFHLYDRVRAGGRFNAEIELDYTPLRLMAVTAWQAWTVRNHPDARGWQADYAFNAPMLWGNTIAALLGSIFVFLIVRLWVIRMEEAQRLTDAPPRPLRGVPCAMVGALLLWFNPALLWNGYAWPQWDAWLLPFALAAIYLACIDWWFAAGVCLAIGASLKGQLLIAAPIMFILPICQFRFGTLLRIVAGFMFASMFIAFPFLNASREALVWYLLMLVGMGLLAPFVLRWRIKWWAPLGAAMLALLIVWPWQLHVSAPVRLLPIALIGVIALSRLLPARLIPHSYALIVAVAILLMMPLFEASTAWFWQGFVYGPNREPFMHGPATNNLPAILQTYLRWPNSAFFKVWGDMEMQQLMGMVYGICLLLCGIGAAIQYRRRDTRFLIAMFLPWLLFFLLLTNVRGRYIVWAAAMSALLPGSGVGMTLLGILVTVIATLETMQAQSIVNRTYYAIAPPDWMHYVTALEPHLGWPLLLIAGISLYYTMTPRTSATMT